MIKILLHSLLLIIFVVSCSCSLVFAQQTDSSKFKSENSLNKGSWSVQFEVGTFLDTKTFQAFLFSAKRHFSSFSALRGGFGFRSNTSSGSENFNSTSFEQNFPNNSKTTYFEASLQFLIYPINKSFVNLYIGLGPLYRYNETKSHDNYVNYMSEGQFVYARETNYKEWTAGISGIFGAEVFLFKGISLLGEYNLQVLTGQGDTNENLYESQPFEGAINSSTHFKSNIFEFSANLIKLGVSAYF